MTEDEMEIFRSEFQNEMMSIYKSLVNCTINHIEKIAESEDESKKLQIREMLEYISYRTSEFLSVISFDLLDDPENWIKFTFHESLKCIQSLRKETLDSVIQSQESQPN
jgi:hypothetical protein